MANRRLPQPSQCPDGFYTVARMCWELAAEDRPCFEELVEVVRELIQEAAFALAAPKQAGEDIYEAIDRLQDDAGLLKGVSHTAMLSVPENAYLNPAETRFGLDVYDNTAAGIVMAEVWCKGSWTCAWRFCSAPAAWSQDTVCGNVWQGPIMLAQGRLQGGVKRGQGANLGSGALYDMGNNDAEETLAPGSRGGASSDPIYDVGGECATEDGGDGGLYDLGGSGATVQRGSSRDTGDRIYDMGDSPAMAGSEESEDFGWGDYDTNGPAQGRSVAENGHTDVSGSKTAGPETQGRDWLRLGRICVRLSSSGGLV